MPVGKKTGAIPTVFSVGIGLIGSN